jgi:hypothetical protein
MKEEELDTLRLPEISQEALLARRSLADLHALRTAVTARLVALLASGNVETSAEYAGYEATLSAAIHQVTRRRLDEVKRAQEAALAAHEQAGGNQQHL